MAKKGLLVATRCYEGVAGSYVAVKGGSCSCVATNGVGGSYVACQSK